MAMDDDDPLDFEKEDQLLKPTPTNKRRKIIGLGDLLIDFYAEQSKLASCQFNRASSSKNCASDEDDYRSDREKLLSQFVDDCEKQVNDMKTDDEMPLWGQRIFGFQKPMPLIMSKGLANCELLRSSSISEYNSIIDTDELQGEGFFEGLLMNGWLSKLAFTSASVEDSLATWTFDNLLYSSNVDLQVSAYEFWHDILLARNKANELIVSLGWLPNYRKLKDALDIYGYLSDTAITNLPPSQADSTVSGCEGPPGNISSWIKVLSVCFQIRNFRAFSSAEAEELLGIVVHLSLDHQLQGLSLILDECMQSIIIFFSEKEWESSCKEVAESLAHRVSMDFNCLRVVESISAANKRSRQLRNQLALQFLIICFDKKVTAFTDIIKLLMKVNVKEENFHFFSLYIKVVLAENFLLSNYPDQEISAMWYKFLRKCSSQITSIDWRPYASKVRNKASYLLQSSCDKRNSHR